MTQIIQMPFKGVLMSTIEHYHLVINECSGSGRGKKISQQVIQTLTNKRLSIELYKSVYPGHTIKLVHSLAQKITQNPALSQLIIIIGGDGTLHEAFLGLGEEFAHLPLGYIPSGSGNDFARGNGIPKNPVKALEQILAADQPKKIDVLQYLDHHQNSTGYAVNNVGIGFDAAIVKKANHSPSKPFLNKIGLNSLVYLACFIQVFFKQASFPLTIIIDGKKKQFEDAFLVTVNNHPYFGGGIPVSPKASQVDGKLDLIILPKLPFLKILYLFSLMITGEKHLNHKDVYYSQSKTLSLKTTRTIDSNADGEELTYQSIDFTLHTSSRYFWH